MGRPSITTTTLPQQDLYESMQEAKKVKLFCTAIWYCELLIHMHMYICFGVIFNLRTTTFFQKQPPTTDQQQQVMPMVSIQYRQPLSSLQRSRGAIPLSVTIQLCDQVGSHALQFLPAKNKIEQHLSQV